MQQSNLRITMPSSFRFLTTCLIALTIFSSFLIALPAYAEGMSLQQLLNAVKRGQVAENQENANREAEFRREKSRQQTLLNQAQRDLSHLEREAERLEAIFNENEIELAEKNAQLVERLGSFGEMFGVIRQTAGATAAQFNASIISTELTGRDAGLRSLASSQSLPTTEALEGLWYTLLENMSAQGQIATFAAPVIDQEGHSSEGTVTRIGPFVAIQEGNYLGLDGDTGGLRELGRQPAGRFLDAARALENADTGEIVAAAIDPSRGTILGLLVQTPSLTERVSQGGLVGYVIIVIGIGGGLLGLARIMSLTSAARSVRRQMKHSDKPVKSNPLGRVLLAADEIDSNNTEVIELKLDDAILQELPSLEAGLPFLKMLGAIAPLLGLLGTVTGMILTFQAITLFGTGDPKLMAGGISQALVTTVLGLIVAIPLLLLHSLASSRSREIIHSLEEQAAGIVATRAEEIA
jgi:biopolymer transport protein ExbB